METKLGKGDVRTLRFNDVELDWSKLPWLNVADRDRAWTKKAYVDLDPAGGLVPTTEIDIIGPNSLYVIVENVDINPADAFSHQNAQVEQFFDFSPFNWWRQIEGTVSPGPTYESEIWTNRLFVIPPGRTWGLIMTNLSALGRVKLEVEIRGWISRIVN